MEASKQPGQWQPPARRAVSRFQIKHKQRTVRRGRMVPLVLALHLVLAAEVATHLWLARLAPAATAVFPVVVAAEAALRFPARAAAAALAAPDWP